MRFGVVLGCALALVPAVRAQELDALHQALAQGAGAPHPDLRPAELARAEVEREPAVEDPRCGRRTRWLLRRGGRPWLWVDQDAEGAVCHYAVSDRDLRVPRELPDGSPRPEDQVAAEREARSRLGLPELERRARAWLARLDPGAEPRPLERVDAHRHVANPVAVVLTFLERPRPGWLACFPNVFVVSLNPETGQVTWFSGSWVEAGQRTPPPVAADAAAREARRRGRPVSGPPELGYCLVAGRPRLVWLVPGEEAPALVDAHTGAWRTGRD